MENKPMISETEKREALKQFMAEKAKAPVCVAFSGGVDSSLILKLACDTAKKTGMPVYAVTFHTMLHPACDLEIAERVAKELGAIHKIIQVNEMELEAIRTNPVNRCYICKHHLFATLLDFAKEEGIPCVMDGPMRATCMCTAQVSRHSVSWVSSVHLHSADWRKRMSRHLQLT